MSAIVRAGLRGHVERCCLGSLSWSGIELASVALVAVDEAVLARLVHAATTDAEADEVTPAVTPGGSWTPARVAWLRDFHRVCRAGLSGPAGEASWAVVVDEYFFRL